MKIYDVHRLQQGLILAIVALALMMLFITAYRDALASSAEHMEAVEEIKAKRTLFCTGIEEKVTAIKECMRKQLQLTIEEIWKNITQLYDECEHSVAALRHSLIGDVVQISTNASFAFVLSRKHSCCRKRTTSSYCRWTKKRPVAF